MEKTEEMNLDLTKILKGCEGITFYTSTHGYVELVKIVESVDYPVVLNILGKNTLIHISANGKYDNKCDGECVFFPSKEQRDWSKFKKPLAVDTPVMVSTGGTNWTLRFYAGNNSCFLDGRKSDKQVKYNWIYIVPVSEFDFENPESNKEKSI